MFSAHGALFDTVYFWAISVWTFSEYMKNVNIFFMLAQTQNQHFNLVGKVGIVFAKLNTDNKNCWYT